MYDVKVFHRIWSNDDFDNDDTQTILFSHTLKLPFPPYIGLKLSEVNWWCSKPIEEVLWDNHNNCFTCNLANAIASKNASYDQLIELALDDGWEKNSRSRKQPSSARN